MYLQYIHYFILINHNYCLQPLTIILNILNLMIGDHHNFLILILKQPKIYDVSTSILFYGVSSSGFNIYCDSSVLLMLVFN